ncbi:MAG: hypothetical protein WBM34_09430 [Woeseiaceae bacterium]|jgi:hypothetical protein
MTNSDDALRDAVRQAQAHAEPLPVTDFDQVWAAASDRVGSVRKRRVLLAGSAAVAVVLAIAFSLRAPTENEWLYIDEYELLETTGWSAPSDSLLPAHEFDIYQNVPVLIESTETYGGALL